MKLRPSTHWTLVGPLLASWLLVSVTPARAEPASDDYERLVIEGDELLGDDKPLEAAQRFDAAYRAMPLEARVGDFGRFVVLRADEAYFRAWEQSHDLAIREANQALLRQLFTDLDAVGRSAPLGEDERRLEQRLDQIERELQALASAKDDATPSAEGDRAPAPRDPRDDDPPERGPVDRLGLGLVIGGGVVAAGGAALAIQGARIPGLLEQARQDSLAAYGLTESEVPPEWAELERRKQAQGRALLASGITLAVVGAAAVAWGSVRIVRRRSPPSLALLPFSHGAGAVLTVGF